MVKNQSFGPAEKALSSAQRHGQSLRAVNEKLADLVVSLRENKQRLVEYSQSRAPPASGGEGKAAMTSDLPQGTLAVDLPQRTLAAELARANEALEHSQREGERIRERLAEIQDENRRLCDEYVAVQQQNSDLVNLYAAVERLHSAPDRAEVLAAIQEIVVNLIGSEELALFELSPDGRRFAPAHAFGIDADDLQEIPVGSGTVGRVAAHGMPAIAGEEGAPALEEASHLTACIPLKLGDKVTGALAIYRLVGHKQSLTDLDREIFAVLEKHAALALHTSALRQANAGGR